MENQKSDEEIYKSVLFFGRSKPEMIDRLKAAHMAIGTYVFDYKNCDLLRKKLRLVRAEFAIEKEISDAVAGR